MSVVIPAYNSEGFLAETVDSVYAQTVQPAEVIVVNDGSTDGTEPVLRQLEQRLPSLRWTTKPNGGQGSARNLGVSLATGELIAFLDHDDRWHRDKLARQLDQFAGDPGLALSFTALNTVTDGSAVLAGRDVPTPGVHYLHTDWDPDPEEVLRRLMSESPIGSCSTVVVRREALKPGFSEHRPISDDWLMWLRMAAAGLRFGHVPEPLVEYHRHETNLSGYRLRRLNSQCAAFDEFLATTDLPRRIQRDIRLRQTCAHRHLVAAIAEAQAGNPGRARYHIRKAARAHPASIRPGWLKIALTGRAAGEL